MIYFSVGKKEMKSNREKKKAWRGLNSCLKIDLFCSFSKAQPGSCGRVQAQRGVHQHGCGRGSAIFCRHETPLLQVTSTSVFVSFFLFVSFVVSGITLSCERQCLEAALYNRSQPHTDSIFFFLPSTSCLLWYDIVFSLWNHDVTKNLTGHRM